MAGLDTDYDGEAKSLAGNRVGYLPQEPELDESKTVLENILDGVPEKMNTLNLYKSLHQKVLDGKASPAEQNKYKEAKSIVDREKLLDLERRVEVSSIALRCPPPDSMVDRLSGGEKRRIALCRLLISAPDILLLDEPTNHLDAESVTWLERYLSEYKGAVLAVTHDRYFLDNVAGWILEIDRGGVYPFDGNYSEWLVAKEKRLALESKKEAAKARLIQKELEWINTSPKARQAKSKSRVKRYEELISEAKKREFETGRIIIPPGPRLGDIVVQANGLSKCFDDRVLFEDLSFDIEPGAIVGVVGPNGAGKTTLFNMISGRETPDSGTIRVGETVHLKHITQLREELDDNLSVVDTISEGNPVVIVGEREHHVRSYMSAFNLKGGIQDRLVGNLSGGERNRVLLAKILKGGCNLLMLDEPSNDLDVDTLRSLEEALSDFAGSAIVISHDRWFLDRICTHILAFEGDSNVVYYNGHYSDYEEDRNRRLGKRSDPTKVRYKRIVVA